VPAAAVIPAPIAYIKVVAVKKLVVAFFKPWLIIIMYLFVLVFRVWTWRRFPHIVPSICHKLLLAKV